MKLFNFNKEQDNDEYYEQLLRKGRRVSNEYSDLVGKYDERTEEIIELLRERGDKLWECKHYYDTALKMKEEIRDLKREKTEKQSEINTLKRNYGEIAERLLENGLIKKPQELKTYDELIVFLEIIQYIDKDNFPLRGIIASMRRLKVSKETIEKDYEHLYIHLKIKDWEV